MVKTNKPKVSFIEGDIDLSQPTLKEPVKGEIYGEKSIDKKKYLLIDGSYVPLEGRETSREYIRWRLRANPTKLTQFEGQWALLDQGKPVVIPIIKPRAPRKKANPIAGIPNHKPASTIDIPEVQELSALIEPEPHEPSS
jgi:hypothetical protein